jgi:hypothetical protein
MSLGPRQTDPINRMIPLSDTHFGINSKQALDILKNDPIKRNEPINCDPIKRIPLYIEHILIKCKFMVS